MESTIQRQYQVTDNSDGSKTLVFKSKKVGVHAEARAGLAKIIGRIFVILFGLYFGVVGVIGILEIFSGEYLTNIVRIIAGIIALPLAFWIWKKFLYINRGTKKTIVLTEQGIVFNNGQSKLNISDIKSVGVETQNLSMYGHYLESNYVVVYALGNKVDITGHASHALADALQKEITDFYSGYFG